MSTSDFLLSGGSVRASVFASRNTMNASRVLLHAAERS